MNGRVYNQRPWELVSRFTRGAGRFKVLQLTPGAISLTRRRKITALPRPAPFKTTSATEPSSTFTVQPPKGSNAAQICQE